MSETIPITRYTKAKPSNTNFISAAVAVNKGIMFDWCPESVYSMPAFSNISKRPAQIAPLAICTPILLLLIKAI